ncbi:MAG TPA: hypothetical protein VEK32_16760 [Thermodesulfobacteriota bacterium]|nr:hypothetical protein [Thermodesulfobacteriota bacterium]
MSPKEPHAKGTSPRNCRPMHIQGPEQWLLQPTAGPEPGFLSTGCPPDEHRQGPPAFILVWLPLRVTPVTPEAHLSVLAVIVRTDASVFPFVGEGRQLHCAFRGYL